MLRKSPFSVSLVCLLGALMVAPNALAAEGLDSGSTAWILTSSALVLFMTLPGLAFFYGGLTRAVSALSVLAQCMIIVTVASLLWLFVGYSLSFSGDGAYLGDLAKSVFSGGRGVVEGGIPEAAFFMFQMTFAIITPALVLGAWVERVKFSAVIWFTLLFLLLIYFPVAHWVWGGGWLAEMGVIDFAGGLVVHTTAGAAALVIAMCIRPRHGFAEGNLQLPHSPGLTMGGAAMLWVGWFGFNGGSALAADGAAAMAITVTHISAATAAGVWVLVDWLRHGKPTLVGLATGAIAGLATITPAAGVSGPLGAVIIGALSGFFCYQAVLLLKIKLKIDDSLDVFAVHGIGGMLGTLMAAVVALPSLDGAGLGDVSWTEQLRIQLTGVAAVFIWTIVATLVIVFLVKMLGGWTVDPAAEEEGIDITTHGERAYELTQ